MNTPNDPRRWATLAYTAHPTWSKPHLLEQAVELFLEYRHWQVKCQRFLRAEERYAALFPCSPCLETVTINPGQGEQSRTYLACYQCQSNLSTRIAVWFAEQYLPAHPEWQIPETDALALELEKLKQPQMLLL